MQVKRFQKQVQTLLDIIGRTVPKNLHVIVGHNKSIPMGVRLYVTDEDPKVVKAGGGRNDHRYVTVEGNFKDDTLAVALRYDLTGPVGEQAVLGHFSGNVNEKLHQVALVSLRYLVNGDKPQVTTAAA